jgi:sigma-B regulation protein RsbU (phosphoserine phosphatase)
VPGRYFWNDQRWRLERLFALLFILWAIFSLTRAPGWTTAILAILLFPIGAVLAFRYLRTGIRRTIWRLRNRLIVTYIFVGVVPALLILLLVLIGSYIIFGQVADYLITTEIERRTDSLSGAAEALTGASADILDERIDEIRKRLLRRFPKIEILVTRGEEQFRAPGESKLQSPPKTWGAYAGLVERNGAHFEFAHFKRDGAEVTLLSPLTSDILSAMVPGMADVQFIDLPDAVHKGATVHVDQANPDVKIRPGQHLPPRANRLDYEIMWLSHPRVPDWSDPNRQHTALITITTRPSAVIDAVFGRSFDTEQVSLIIFLIVAGIFLLVEIGSIIIGISLTRTMTGAVHELYEGTERVTAGDFSHRISVKGNDQLSELAKSFNSMTENLERLIVVAKEKERLESEIEIARGVQNQLFPKAAPAMKTIHLSGSCQPARMVSGDYYDFLCLPDGNVAIAIGDVAGKGIAAALLMASIQSIMRTQLTSGIPRPGNGKEGARMGGSVSQMVGELNRQLYLNTSPEKYATFCFGLYDEEEKSLTYTNAGHLPPILLHNGQPQLLEVTGTVVGLFPMMRYEERKIAMESGDILLAYTDGIVEPENPYGEEFGAERMMDLVVKHQTEASEEIIARIMEAVPHWTGSSELSDDMTVVLARRTT